MRIHWAMTTLAALTSFGFAACSSDSVEPPPQPPVNWQSFAARAPIDAGTGPTPRERAIAPGYVTALASAGFAELGPWLAEDARFGFPGASDAHGRDAVVRAHQVLFGAFDARALTTSRIFRTSAEQTVEWTMTGLQARDWMGVAATGKPVVIHGLALLYTQDAGSITDVRVSFDVASVKAQLGAGPKPAPASPPSAPSAGVDAGGSGNAGVPEIVDQTGSPEETANVSTVRASLDALEKGNLGAYLASFADGVELAPMGRTPGWHAKSDAGAYFAAMHKAIGQLDTTMTDGWGAGSFAVIVYTIAGQQVGPLGGIAVQRDKAVLLHVVDIAEIREGKIARIWRYDNPGEIMATPPG